MTKNAAKDAAQGVAPNEQDAAAAAAAAAEAEQLAAEKALVERREREAAEKEAAEKAAAEKAEKEAAAAAAAAQAQADAEAAAAEAAAARKKVGVRYYRTVHGGVMIDPSTLKEFSGEKATKSELTGWLEFQIAHGKIAEDTE